MKSSPNHSVALRSRASSLRKPRARTVEKPAPVREASPTLAAAYDGRKPNKYSIELVERAIDILFAFNPSRPAMDLGELVALTKLPKTTTFRILNTLVERNLCEKQPDTGRYSLGFKLLHLAEVKRRQSNLHDLAMPIMREIRDLVEETVVLSVRTGDFRVHIDAAEGLHQMRRMIEPGRQAPLYAGAAGKVMLAGFNGAQLNDYLTRTPLKQYQKNTITNPATLLKQLKQVRERGFAESHGEIVAGGGGALAAPIKDASGAVIAALDILTAEGRYTPQHRERCIQLLLDGTRRLSERLGYRVSL